MTPPPVDLNKLKSILGASKAIMNKVESGNYETGHIDSRALTEEGVQELQAAGVTKPAMQSTQHLSYDAETIQNSRLPEAVKKLMIERPIPQMSNPNYTFSLDDVADLAEDKPMRAPKAPQKRQVYESVSQNSELISLTKEDLKEMVSTLVNEKLLDFFAKNYNKMMTEDTVKKTVNMLIKEGRLIPKKKTL